MSESNQSNVESVVPNTGETSPAAGVSASSRAVERLEAEGAMTRRTFLRTTGLAAAGLGAVGVGLGRSSRAAYAWCGGDEVVFPTGGLDPDGTDQTDELLEAFDAAMAHKAQCPDDEVVVQLNSGTFKFRNIYVEEFIGTLRGAGIGETVIDTVGEKLLSPVPGVDFDGFRAADYRLPAFLDVISGRQIVPWFCFRNGRIGVCHMTFHPTAYEPVEEYIHGRWGTPQNAIGATVRFIGEETHSALDHVAFLSSEGTTLFPQWGPDGGQYYVGTNVAHHIFYNHTLKVATTKHDEQIFFGHALMRGSHSITNCVFGRAFTGPVAFGLTDGAMVVGGSADSGNTFEDLVFNILQDTGDGYDFEISHNTFNNVHDVGVQTRMFDWVLPTGTDHGVTVRGYADLWGTPSAYRVTDNDFRLTTARGQQGIGVSMYDYYYMDLGETGALVTVSGNDISSDGGALPIVSNFTRDVLCCDNYITGDYLYGINPWSGSDGWTIRGNKLGTTREGAERGMYSTFGAVSVEESDGCTVIENEFIRVTGEYGAVWVNGSNNQIGGYRDASGAWRTAHNNYTRCPNLRGWHNWNPNMFTGEPYLSGCILLFPSCANIVDDPWLPPGSTVCNQNLDLSELAGSSCQVANAIEGFGSCPSTGLGVVPSHLQDMLDALRERQRLDKEELLARLEDLTGRDFPHF